jgi:hypothetical protein
MPHELLLKGEGSVAGITNDITDTYGFREEKNRDQTSDNGWKLVCE